MGSLVPLLALLFLSCLVPAYQQSDEETVSLPLTPPIASAEVVEQNDATCPSSEAHNVLQDTLQPLILSTADTVVPCTQQVKGLVPHCPARNCTELFILAQEKGVILLSNYYWLRGVTGEVRRVYCNRDTQQPEYSSCDDVFELNNLPTGTYTIRPSGGNPVTMFCNNETRDAEYLSCADIHQVQPDLPSGIYTIRPSGGNPVTIFCNNETGETEYVSCADIHQVQPDLPSGMYTIRSSEGNPVTVYCDMDSEGCGGGGWTRVASYDYGDSSIECPSSWTQMTTPVRGCTLTHFGCVSSSFSTQVEFTRVCGKVISIQRDTPDSFAGPDSIDSNYLDGVSITYGSPRQHIWSFAAYPSDTYTGVATLCPCSQPSLNVPPPPSFIGNNYFCDTGAPSTVAGYYTDDPLWDGQGCRSPSTCCSFNNPPWFNTALPQSTTDDIEVRICRHDSSSPNDNTILTLLDLYIK